MALIEQSSSPLGRHGLLLKAAFDKIVAAIALALLAPLMVLIALAIRIDSDGPVLYVQRRHGWDGRVIKVLKFRTMHPSTSASPDLPFRQATRNDPRVTRIGRLLRRSSLDELPQFLNVLQGNMSVVGPRPHPVALSNRYTEQIDHYMQRHRVKPGITGWAQVNGLRGETEDLEKMRLRVAYDLYYIDNWSLWLDLKILLLTLVRGWFGKNVY